MFLQFWDFLLKGYICPPWLQREYPRFLDLWDFLQKGLEAMDELYLPTLVRKIVPGVISRAIASPNDQGGQWAGRQENTHWSSLRVDSNTLRNPFTSPWEINRRLLTTHSVGIGTFMQSLLMDWKVSFYCMLLCLSCYICSVLPYWSLLLFIYIYISLSLSSRKSHSASVAVVV